MGCSGCDSCNARGLHGLDENLDFYDNGNGLNKLNSTDWLGDIDDSLNKEEIVEVQFKNTRKEYFKNTGKIPLKKGDKVVVEASIGHDVGTVSLTGTLVLFQLKKRKWDLRNTEFKTVYRKARASDIEKWKTAMELERETMLKTRKIVESLGLDMKISDVEYQGDKTKVIFYYIAEERVDFRELIKILAEQFRVRIEMKQIGARQEAGRVGGIGSCGRELCCSSWKTNFNSVNINAAFMQDLPANAQKLAGQCGKLKCCLMYELDTYIDAKNDFPKVLLQLETEQGIAYHHKTDALKKLIWYSYSENEPVNLIAVPVSRVKEIINLNKRGIKVVNLVEAAKSESLNKDQDFVYGSKESSQKTDKFIKNRVKRG